MKISMNSQEKPVINQPIPSYANTNDGKNYSKNIPLEAV